MSDKSATNKRPITVEDLYKLKSLEDPRISPNGEWVAFVKVDIDKATNGYKRNIWLCSLVNDTKPLQLTRSGKDSQPRWSPNGGILAFVSGRGDKPQVYALPLTAFGGEARALTSHPNGVSGFNWSPDGSQIAFLAAVNADEIAKEDSGETETPPIDKLEGKHRAERREEDERKKTDPRVVSRVPYRLGTAFVSDRYTQIYVIGIEDGAKARRLTNIEVNHQEPQWSPDGKYIWTARMQDPELDEPYRKSRLYRIRVEDGVSEAFQHSEYADVQPLPSPDGQWVLYLRFPEEQAAIKYNRLSVVPAQGGDVRELSLKADISPTNYRWSQGDVWFTGERHGAIRVYRVSPMQGEVQEIYGGAIRIDGFDIHDNGTMVFVLSMPDVLQEMYVLRPDNTTPKRLTEFNTALLDEVISQPYHHLQFTAPDGQALEGWYLLPTDYEAGKRYPLALYVHGGPHIMWGPSNSIEWYEWQNIAAKGYVLFFCNPRGSGGYGEAFQLAVYGGGWGDLAYNDIMAGVEMLIAQGLVDPANLFVTGGSYGGYMTTWMVSHTERFKAAVSQRGVYNLLSFYGTSDIPTFVKDEFGTLPMDNPTFLWEHSPLAHAHKIKTPLLILHAENDYRVPISEAEQLFGYLRRVGTPTEFVRYPRDGHELTRAGEPEHRIDHLSRILAWFEKYRVH